MRPELFADWPSKLLAWASAYPCRRPSWLCAPLPSCSRLLYSTWLDLSSRTWTPCSYTVSLKASVTCSDSGTYRNEISKPGGVCWLCDEKLIYSYVIIFPVVLQPELFVIFFHIWCIFASHTFWEGGRGEAGLQMHQLKKENIWCTTPSAVTFALWFDSPLALSQPCSPDKKDPLLRCFARHYKTVAMDTHSEQAPHPGSRVGNDRCNISLFFFF